MFVNQKKKKRVVEAEQGKLRYWHEGESNSSMVTKWRLTFTSSHQLFSLIYMMAEKSICLLPREVPLYLCLLYIVSIFSFLGKKIQRITF